MVVFDFTGKNALITGAGGGLGGATAEIFARAGAKVYVADIYEHAAEAVAKKITEEGGIAVPVKLDVTNADEIASLMKKIVDDDGKIDILVTCAAIMFNKAYMDTTEKELRMTLDVNLIAVDNVCREALKYMIPAKQGKILNIESAAARAGNAICAHYSSSKFAVMGLTQSIALAVAKDNINVNGLCPGVIDTTLGERHDSSTVSYVMRSRGITRQQALDIIESLVPMGRWQQPEDVGYAALFLCSEYARNITGQALNVDGAYRLN